MYISAPHFYYYSSSTKKKRIWDVMICTMHNAHWGCIRVSGGWGKPSLQEFDYNALTKDQVFIKINNF